MEDAWDGWGSAGIRRRSGVGGPPQGGPPDGLLEAPSRQSTGESLGAPADDEEEAPSKRRGGPSSFALVSCYTATLSLLFLACAVGGCFLGIFISKPQLKAVEAGTDASPSSSTVFVDVEGEYVRFGGVLLFPLELHNSSSFSLSFFVSDFEVYYYPIGSSRQCLLYHGGTLLSQSSPAFKYRQRFGTPSNGSWVSLAQPDNEVHVKPSEGSEATTTRLDLPWRVGLRIPKDSDDLLQQLKPLVDDCINYNTVVLGLEVTQGFSRSFLADVQIPGAIHVVQAVSCNVSDEAKNALEKLQRTYTPVFLEGLSNDPTLFQSSAVSQRRIIIDEKSASSLFFSFSSVSVYSLSLQATDTDSPPVGVYIHLVSLRSPSNLLNSLIVFEIVRGTQCHEVPNNATPHRQNVLSGASSFSIHPCGLRLAGRAAAASVDGAVGINPNSTQQEARLCLQQQKQRKQKQQQQRRWQQQGSGVRKISSSRTGISNTRSSSIFMSSSPHHRQQQQQQQQQNYGNSSSSSSGAAAASPH
ncbi:hypothetical protein Emed_000078 [Eimeria media]